MNNTIPFSINEENSPAYNLYREYLHWIIKNKIGLIHIDITMNQFLLPFNAILERGDDPNEHDLIVFKSNEDKLMFILRWA